MGAGQRVFLDAEPVDLAKNSSNAYAGRDVFTGMKSNVPLHFGSPDWPGIFKKIKKTQEDKTIGVFFCGHPAIGASLNKCSEQFSDDVSYKFVPDSKTGVE